MWCLQMVRQKLPLMELIDSVTLVEIKHELLFRLLENPYDLIYLNLQEKVNLYSDKLQLSKIVLVLIPHLYFSAAIWDHFTGIA